MGREKKNIFRVWGSNQRVRATEQSKASQRAKNLEEAAFVLRGKSVGRRRAETDSILPFTDAYVRAFERRAPAVAEQTERYRMQLMCMYVGGSQKQATHTL